MSKFYVTTPIYYVNGDPHIGHAYTTIIADVFARHYRQRGHEVAFLTGTDEHGLKIQREAESQGITPKALADINSKKFSDLFDRYELTHDRFIRTTDEDHKAVVYEFVERMKANGDVYLGSYAGWYAASDEAFYGEDEIKDGKSIETGADVEWVEESSYFFKLSAYQDKLVDWYNANDTHVSPDSKRKEVLSFVEGGLLDLSISRTTFDWGLPFPDDPEHVLYVWVDALTNYATGRGGLDAWDSAPADLQILGKDILRFHAVYWPAFLMSAGIAPPKQVFAHGWWLNEGRKMSKRDGNVIDAFELADRFPLDVLRYFMVRELPLGGDGNFANARVAERNNSELADNLGNLVNRTFAMAAKFCDAKIPVETEPNAVDITTPDMLQNASNLVHANASILRDDIIRLFDERGTHVALEKVMGFAKSLNLYIQENQPWKLAKDESAAEQLQAVMYNVLEGIRWIGVLVHPFLPDTSAKILAGLGVSDIAIDSLVWGGAVAGTALQQPEVLFAKIEIEEEPDVVEPAPKKKKKSKSKKSDGPAPQIEFDQFLAVDIRIGEIVTAEKVEGADKLLKLQVRVGADDERQVVAGIAKSYAPDTLPGKRLAVVTNLKPAKIFKIESQAMLLAADTDDGGMQLTFFPDTVAVGTRLS